MRFRFTIIFIAFFCNLLTSCTKDKDAPVVEYFIINGQSISEDTKADFNDVLQLKITVTDEGGLAMHSLKYNVNNIVGDELIYISDEIVNTIVEEFYLDLSELERNATHYACKSGDVVEFHLQAEDLNGNNLDRNYQVLIR